MSQLTFSQILAALAEPFPSSEVGFKPGALNKEKTKALALAYVDSRPYIQRLNQVAPEWQDEYEIILLPDRVVVLCSLTLAGVTRTGDGECLFSGGEDEGRTEPNAVTTASAQAFKRACVKFGLGAYLYGLPQVWCDYDHARRRIVNPPDLPEWALSPAERAEKATRAAVEREAREKGIMLEEPQPAPIPAMPVDALPNPGDTIIHFGKMIGKTIAEVWQSGPAGQGWVRWCANTAGNGIGFEAKKPEDVHLQRMARAFLALNAAYAG